MSIKSLFEKQKEISNLKGFTKSTIEQFSGDVESAQYVEQKKIYEQTFIPDLDYSSESNFVKFGSAEKYYKNSIDRIQSFYPYDGSKSEKLEFYNSITPLEKYLLDNEYPRTTGYVNFAPNGWGTRVGAQINLFGEPDTKEYISFYNQSINNIYDPANGRRENTRFVFATGSTVEFWLKKDSFTNPATQTEREAIFYSTTSDLDKRIVILLDSNTVGSVWAVYATDSGTTLQFSFEYDTGLSNIADSNWHHYAITFYHSGSNYYSDFYFDGAYKSTEAFATSPAVDLTGSSFNTVGALGGGVLTNDNLLGWGKLSGSIDEFRFWNTKRDAKQIGINYFTNVGGGTNTDLANVDLGVYFKFNEGITQTSSVDSVVLDYAGRVCNGTFLGYGSSSRSTGSAINDATDSIEPTEPIIYSQNPLVVAYAAEKQLSGSSYDASNPGSLINSIPSWILDEDVGDNLVNFLQVLASYLDTLYLQISGINKLKNIVYQENNVKQNPFNNKLLTSLGFDTPDLFINSDILASIFDQDDKRLYEEKIDDIKNAIYKNIYNNLIYINKSKGTEKAFRNLIRCFGADDDLFKLTIYANNANYKYVDKYTNVGVNKAYLDMNEIVEDQNVNAVIYQYPDASNLNSVGIITASSNRNIGNTLEAEVVFPKLSPTYNKPHLGTPLTYTSQSIFGIHEGSAADETDTTFQTPDRADVEIYAVSRDDLTKFVITSSLGFYGETDPIRDVYNDSRWNLSFRLKPTEYPFVSGTYTASSYTAEFYGYHYDSGELINSFTSSFTVATASAFSFYDAGKRVYAGAHRTNITGALLTSTNIKLLSVRYWSDYMEDSELKVHARDIRNYGRNHPYRNTFVYEAGDIGSVYIPKIETLSLFWDFETLSTSSASGIIPVIPDVKSASIDLDQYPDSYDDLVGFQHTGKGEYFADSYQAKKNEYYNSSKIQIPENLDSSDLIQILENDDDRYTTDTLPQSMFFSVESSMYDVISRQALDFFSTIVDFNNLVGEPVNKYRIDYKDLTKLRQLFFDKVENSPDLDKYVGLYKWVDDALEGVLGNLIPASANASDKVRTIVENHVLERNKFQYTLVSSGSLPNKVSSNNGSEGQGEPTTPTELNPFGDVSSTLTSADILQIPPIVNSEIPTDYDLQKLHTPVNTQDYIESTYVVGSYREPPSAEAQTTGFNPNAKFRFPRTDTNLYSNPADSTNQEATRQNVTDNVRFGYTKIVKFSNHAITNIVNPGAFGAIGNINLSSFQSFANTDNPNTIVILTPDTKQVLLVDNNVKQQINFIKQDD